MSSRSNYDHANKLRSQITAIYKGLAHDRLVLTPGLLAGVNVFLGSIRAKSILITNEEYYTSTAFAGMQVSTCPFEATAEMSRDVQPDVVLISPVTWKGRITDALSMVNDIRSVARKRNTIIIADCSHVGAAGFLHTNISADIVIGDSQKWLLHNDTYSNCAFLAFQNEALFQKACHTFAPYYLALPKQAHMRKSRWISPEILIEVCRALDQISLPSNLEESHLRNIELAKVLSMRWLGHADVDTAILMIPETPTNDEVFAKLETLGLTWQLPCGAVRVLCISSVAQTENLINGILA